MEILKKVIKEKAKVLDESVLKVDTFLTHQVDINLMDLVGTEFYKRFSNKPITKVLTLESAGIAPAAFVAQKFGVPMIFVRKHKSITMDKEMLEASVHSFTKQVTNKIALAKDLLTSEDCVLIIDDFLAQGQAALGLSDLCHQAGAQVAGIGIVIEKSFQEGRLLLEQEGYHVESLARITSFENNEVHFLNE